jgi:putative transposase
MTNYRRNFVAGGSFFFTVNLAERRLRLLTDHVSKLRTAFRETRRRHSFEVAAIVVLPDHLHAIWTLPEGDADFSTRWRLIKSAFSRNLAAGEQISRSRAAKGERGIWQRRYWEHTIRETTISCITSTTFISTRSSMGLSRGSGIGRIRRSIAW